MFWLARAVRSVMYRDVFVYGILCRKCEWLYHLYICVCALRMRKLWFSKSIAVPTIWSRKTPCNHPPENDNNKKYTTQSDTNNSNNNENNQIVLIEVDVILAQFKFKQNILHAENVWIYACCRLHDIFSLSFSLSLQFSFGGCHLTFIFHFHFFVAVTLLHVHLLVMCSLYSKVTVTAAIQFNNIMRMGMYETIWQWIFFEILVLTIQHTRFVD